MPTLEQVAQTLMGTSDEVTGFNTPPPPAEQPPAQAPASEQVETPSGETATETTPAVNTPTPPANEPANTTQFNLDEQLSLSTNGLIKSKDDLSAIAEQAQKATDFQNRVAELERELSEKNSTNPFANDYTKKLNDLYQGGASQTQIDAFMVLNKVDVNQLTPFQLSSLALQVKHGLEPSLADAVLADKYGIDPEAMNDPNFKLDALQEAKLKIDSDADKTYLNQHKAEVSTPPASQAEQQQRLFEEQNQQRIAQVTPVAKNIVTDVVNTAFKAFSINGRDGDKAVKIDLPISPEIAQNIEDAAQRYVQQFDIKNDEKGKQDIKNFVENSLWISNGKRWITEAVNQRELQIRAEYDNPSTANPNRGEANPVVGKTKEQSRADAVMAALDL